MRSWGKLSITACPRIRSHRIGINRFFDERPDDSHGPLLVVEFTLLEDPRFDGLFYMNVKYTIFCLTCMLSFRKNFPIHRQGLKKRWFGTAP